MKKLIEYWPLLTACLLYFGFCNLHYYYRVFNIDIFSFITSGDILLSLFPQIVLLSTTLYGLIAQQLYTEIKKTDVIQNAQTTSHLSSDKKHRRLLWFKKHIEFIVAFYFTLIIAITLLLEKVFHYKSYELTDFFLFTDVIFILLIYIAVSIADRNKLVFEKPILIALFLIVFIGQKIGSYRTNEALKIKDGIIGYKKDHISFDYNGQKIKSTDSLVLIGQTTAYLFLYSLKDSTTEIFSNSKIENLKVK